MHDLVTIRRALISVSDKTGVVDFAKALAARGVTIISTGGTAKLLAESGVAVVPVERVTGFPEMMDGRVKTLHPMVHGGILAVRSDPEHQRAMREHNVEPIDLVCVSLYPFEQTIAREGCTREDAIENIDVGGPTMIRAAAKNHEFVAVVTDPGQYQRVLAELDVHAGATTHALRTSLAGAAFAKTAAYDAAIAAYMARDTDASAPGAGVPAALSISMPRASELRYGENPHQHAAVYRDPAYRGPSIVSAKQLHGKELSYNNLNDGAAALALALDLARAATGRVGACVIKHANPCGAAAGDRADIAIDLALRGDPIAAYGGILACSARIDAAAAQVICRPNQFLEVVLAPAFDDDALALLRARSANVRLLALGDTAASTAAPAALTFKSIAGGALAQTADAALPDTAAWQHKAGPAPSAATLDAARVLWTVVKHLSSNAVAIGGVDPALPGGVRLFGAGAGQMDRVTSCRLAVEKSGALARGGVACSDAFFPFADGPTLLAGAGVACIVHTGGSKRDQDTFDLCNQRGVTCLTTGVRHFRH